MFSKEKNNSNKTIETPDDEQIEELIQNVLKIKDAIVREIMIPKVNISYINEDSDMQEVYKTIQDTRHSRYPVFDKTSENAVGVLHVKDLIDEEINDKNVIIVPRDSGFNDEKKINSAISDLKSSGVKVIIGPIAYEEFEQAEKFSDLIFVLFDQALLAEGGQLQNPSLFVKRLNGFLLDGLRKNPV